METKKGKLSDFKPDDRNANKGTEYGGHLLKKSLQTYGAGRSVLADKNGRFIAGNKTAEECAALGMDDVIVVHSDGKKLVVVQRDDLDIDSEEGRALALLDNKVSQVNLDFDVEVVDSLAADFNLDLKALGFDVIETEPDGLRDEYSPKVGEVLYNPNSSNHKPEDLFQRESKFDREITCIHDVGIREMLQARAAYFSSFNFAKIADYYAYQATQDEKRIFEKLSLVLLDRDQLVENGFSNIVEQVKDESGFNEE